MYPDAGLPATSPIAPTTAAPLITTPSAALPATPLPTVDAQWAFPASAIAQAGRPLVLTTIVSRRTDRAPLAGWTVRYEVTDSGASLGRAGGNVVDVPTDAAGRASVEISPASTGNGASVVNMTVVQPPQIAPVASPQLEIARGTATITWTGGVANPAPMLTAPIGSPPPDLSGPSLPDTRQPAPFEPPPSLSNDSASPRTFAPPSDKTPAGKPELQVEVRRRGPEQVAVGGFASFDVLVTNRGDGTARGIKVLDRFDAGLSHPKAKANEFAIKYDSMRDLPPGESATVALTFGVRAAGQQCHEVTITAAESASVIESGCVTGVEPKSATPPTLEVTKLGPVRHYVGETAKFRIVIKNSGEVPVTNLEIVDHYDDAFEPRFTDPGREILPDGSFKWKIARLEKGERREINVQCACVSPARSACSLVTVTADGDVNIADEKCVEIQQAAP